jgi:small Trp-rich protein
MAFLIVGIVLLATKLAEFGPAAAWDWWLVLLPFGLAVAWWGFADSTGLTQRRAMDKMEKTKVDRRNRNLEALGLAPRPGRRGRAAGTFQTAAAARRNAKDPVSAAADEAAGRR